jgi:hypothetical protein
MSGTTTFRDTIRRISPGWLQRFWGYRVLYSLAIQLDALGDATSFGVKSRFPNVYSNETLPIIGRERGITRGFDETDAAYALRLTRWLDDHRRRGNPYTLLRQIQGYLAPHVVRLRIVNTSGVWFTLNADGSIEYFEGGNWDWDGDPAQPSRFWMIIYPPGDLWVRDGTWGDGAVWGDNGQTWGSTAPIEQVETIRQIITEWEAPHSKCINVIVSFDAAAFDPTDTAPPLPDGTWAHWSKLVAGDQVPARDDRAIYWDGVS